MAYRDIPTSEAEMKTLLRDLIDRLERLEKGGAVAGEVSFGQKVVIGGLELVVTDTGGGHRTLTFRSPFGTTSVIVL